MQKVSLTFHDFVTLMSGLDYYKIGDTKYENIPLSHMYKEKKKCEDMLVYISVMSRNPGITVLNDVRGIETVDIKKTEIGEYSKDRAELIKMIEMLNQRIHDELLELYGNQLKYLTEICVSHDKTHHGVYKMEKGCVHSFKEPAYRSLNSDHTQYFIYGNIVDYRDWSSHPSVRQNKLNKILNRIKHVRIR